MGAIRSAAIIKPIGRKAHLPELCSLVNSWYKNVVKSRKYNRNECRKAIVRGEVISKAILERRGKKLVWFRYPFLATLNNEPAKAIEDFLHQRGYKIAPVSVDYHDYSFTLRINNPQMVQRLLHEWHDQNRLMVIPNDRQGAFTGMLCS